MFFTRETEKIDVWRNVSLEKDFKFPNFSFQNPLFLRPNLQKNKNIPTSNQTQYKKGVRLGEVGEGNGKNSGDPRELFKNKENFK
jgi:hypothetical protein